MQYGSTYLSLLYIRQTIGTPSGPVSETRRQVARVIASSNAWVAPFAEVGRKGCALSPTCTTRPYSEVHLALGFLGRLDPSRERG
jgi:hypothetical protein